MSQFISFYFFFTVIEQQEAKTELFSHVSKRHVNFYVYVDKENIYDSALFKKRKLKKNHIIDNNTNEWIKKIKQTCYCN